MSKTFLLMIAAMGLTGCEAYSGRSTNCFGGSSLSLVEVAKHKGDALAGGCDDWIIISD